MTYTVTLELPDLCDPGDWQNSEPTPIDAVKEFISDASGSPYLYVYRVKHDDGREWNVDMSEHLAEPKRESGTV